MTNYKIGFFLSIAVLAALVTFMVLFFVLSPLGNEALIQSERTDKDSVSSSEVTRGNNSGDKKPEIYRDISRHLNLLKAAFDRGISKENFNEIALGLTAEHLSNKAHYSDRFNALSSELFKVLDAISAAWEIRSTRSTSATLFNSFTVPRIVEEQYTKSNRRMRVMQLFGNSLNDSTQQVSSDLDLVYFDRLEVFEQVLFEKFPELEEKLDTILALDESGVKMLKVIPSPANYIERVIPVFMTDASNIADLMIKEAGL